MKQYSESEILELLGVSGGSEVNQAAALAVVAASIIETRRLGRIALRQVPSNWVDPSTMRGPIEASWQASARPGLD